MKTSTAIVLTLALSIGVFSAIVWFYGSPTPVPTPPAVALAPADPPPAPQAAEKSTPPQPAPRPAAQPIPQPDAGEPIVPKPVARMALSYVGADPDAEDLWAVAINDPNLPADTRKDLIEDLNEEGF